MNKMTKDSVAALAGQGLVVSAKDTYPRDGDTLLLFGQLCRSRSGCGDRQVLHYRFSGVWRCGHGDSSPLRWRPGSGRSTLGIGHAIGQKWVFDPEYGIMVSKRFYQTKPPTILDVPVDMQWNALNIPDPETPVGARGVGEPPVGGGCAAILNALSDALGDEIFRRAPVNADTILASLEAGQPMQHPLMANISRWT